MTRTDLLIKDIDYLVTCDKEWNIFQNAALAVTDGKIVYVGSNEEIIEIFRAKETISLKGHILMPGLVNCHVHSPMSIFRGIADDMPLQKWLHEVIFPVESRWINRETVYVGAMLSIIEMVLSGTTTFCDGYFFEEEVASAALSCGMRAIVGQGVLDFPTPDNPEPKNFLKRAETFLNNFPSNDLVKPSVFCHAPYTCSSETMKITKEFCSYYNIIFQIHLAETKQEVKQIKDRYGMNPGELLQELGLLDDKTLCVHAVWLEDKELDIIKEHSATLVHCVESNLKLASGIAPVPKWMSKGITFGLGTDGPSSNNDLNLLGELTTVALVHKGINKDPTVCKAEDVLKLATIQGARSLGLEESIGSLEVGKDADLIALDITKPHATPIYDPVSHIVYSAKASDVKHVWIRGCQVVQNRRILSFDVESLLNEVKGLSNQIKKSLSKD